MLEPQDPNMEDLQGSGKNSLQGSETPLCNGGKVFKRFEVSKDELKNTYLPLLWRRVFRVVGYLASWLAHLESCPSTNYLPGIISGISCLSFATSIGLRTAKANIRRKMEVLGMMMADLIRQRKEKARKTKPKLRAPWTEQTSCVQCNKTVALSIFYSNCLDPLVRTPMLIPETLHPDQWGESRVTVPVRRRITLLRGLLMEAPTR